MRVYFIDVDIELGQSMENQFSLIDEDLSFLLEELLAIWVRRDLPFFISSGMVALNMSTCLWWGVLMKMSWISALILAFPRTLSHSSITKNLHWIRRESLFGTEWVCVWPDRRVCLEWRWWCGEFCWDLWFRSRFLREGLLRSSNHISIRVS